MQIRLNSGKPERHIIADDSSLQEIPRTHGALTQYQILMVLNKILILLAIILQSWILMSVYYLYYKPNSMKDFIMQVCLPHVTSKDPIFYLTGTKFKIGADNKDWIHPVENNCSISDDLELQLVAREMWRSKSSNMILWWWVETGGLSNLSEVMNSEWYTTLPPTVRYLEK